MRGVSLSPRLMPLLCVYALLLAGSVLFITPFLFALSASLKKLDGVYAYPPALIPHEPQWSNHLHFGGADR